MDEQDREFETFLRQFHLREHAAFPAEGPVEVASPWHGRRWIVATVAAAAAVVAVLLLPLLRDLSNPVSPVATVEISGDSTYKAGDTIMAGNTIHSGGFETLLLRLRDGTRLEMRAQSRIAIESAEDGALVRLNNGSILVRAAKQTDGHLYVKTSDTLVSVLGTLFLVESLPQGSRVAVLEGEVEVRLGTETTKLAKGQQASSNSEIEFASVEELIAWSREVGSLKTLVGVGERGGVTGSEEKPREVRREPLRSAARGAGQRGQTPQQPQPPPPQPPQEQPQTAPSPEGQQQSDAGRQTFYRACVACHNDQIAQGRQWPSREAVANRVSIEISRGAQVSPPEVQPLVDYIFTNFGVKGGRGPARGAK